MNSIDDITKVLGTGAGFCGGDEAGRVLLHQRHSVVCSGQLLLSV